MGLQEALALQERAWEERPLVRRQYAEFYRRIVRRLSDVEGPTVELGSGIGKLKLFKPDVVTTDIEPTPWAEAVIDAERLPYPNRSVANLVLLDVFHHLADPSRFLDEAARTLKPGGRVVIVDPYCSLLSTTVYRAFHHERTDLSVSAFEHDPDVGSAPLESNQARSTLVFFRHRDEYERRWLALPIVCAERFSFLVYPLTGGFSGPSLLPARLYSPLAFVERLFRPAAPLLAFRCLVALERR